MILTVKIYYNTTVIIRKYDIELHRLAHEDIELVRTMRNSTSIRQKMIYQEYITAEMQEKWFQSIDNVFNYYFIIKHKGKKVGLVHGKNADFSLKQCETGILLWNEKDWFTGIAIQAVICALDFAFSFLDFNVLYSTVRIDNPIALRYNLKLGFETIRSEEYHLLKLSKKKYAFHRKKINEYLNHKTGDSQPLHLDDFELFKDGIDQSWINELPEEVQKNFSISTS